MKILYVEDEPHIQKIAKLSLEKIGGFEFEACGSAQEALEMAPAYRPDLILLDVMMPEMDGTEALQAFRKIEETQETPIVFVTARLQKHEIEYFRSLGAIAVIGKPFDAIRLPEIVSEIWQNHTDAPGEPSAQGGTG
jgi:two-component system, OmpR family, response regulator